MELIILIATILLPVAVYLMLRKTKRVTPGGPESAQVKVWVVWREFNGRKCRIYITPEKPTADEIDALKIGNEPGERYFVKPAFLLEEIK